jgi:hypothetical protein
MVEKYRFLKYPQVPADFNVTDGITFSMGRLGDIYIDEIKIFNNGLLISTGESTTRAEEVFEDLVKLWIANGRTDPIEFIQRRVYISELAVRLDVDLKLNALLETLVADTFSDMKPTGLRQIGYFLGGDANNPPAVVIDRLLGAPLDANQYWAQAPLATDEHVKFLESFERILLSS